MEGALARDSGGNGFLFTLAFDAARRWGARVRAPSRARIYVCYGRGRKRIGASAPPGRKCAPQSQNAFTEFSKESPSAAAAMARSTSYESKSDTDSIEELTKRLTADLRKHIRALVRGVGLGDWYAAARWRC